MHGNLNWVVDYLEVTVNIYSPGEFQSHFGLTRRSCEQFCQEDINTGHIPMSNRGKEHINPKKTGSQLCLDDGEPRIATITS